MLRKLIEPRIWGRIYRERLGEPAIYNVASLFVAAFGNIVSKIDYDLVPRQPYAFGLQKAFQFGAAERERLQLKRLVFLEFGVASGAGLLNMCRVSERLARYYGVDYRVIGLDAGDGMPAPVDFRDHPEKYLDGDFAPHDVQALQRALPAEASIIYGQISETVRRLDTMLEPGDMVGFVSIDVDYWSSTLDCFKLFDSSAVRFLPRTPVYLDDVNNIDHHPYAGELLAVSEFNATHDDRKITRMNQLRSWRIFKNALWIDQLYWFLDLGNAYFTREYHSSRARTRLSNPYLGMKLEDAP